MFASITNIARKVTTTKTDVKVAAEFLVKAYSALTTATTQYNHLTQEVTLHRYNALNNTYFLGRSVEIKDEVFRPLGYQGMGLRVAQAVSESVNAGISPSAIMLNAFMFGNVVKYLSYGSQLKTIIDSKEEELNALDNPEEAVDALGSALMSDIEMSLNRKRTCVMAGTFALGMAVRNYNLGTLVEQIETLTKEINGLTTGIAGKTQAVKSYKESVNEMVDMLMSGVTKLEEDRMNELQDFISKHSPASL